MSDDTYYNLYYNQAQAQHQNPTHQFHPCDDHISFTNLLNDAADHSVDYNTSTLSTAFDLSSSSSQPLLYTLSADSSTQNVISTCTAAADADAENPFSPNSSLSISSSEDHSSKINKQIMQSQHGDVKSKNISKEKKKVEKRPREARFAFMTKSEIDNLEDGYRWRKYGQKAVKNSTFPRNYYRCTSQKCSVKKRIERSFVDPSVVITTYEGQHNHHSPATLRGNAAIMMPQAAFPSFPQAFLFPTTTTYQNQPNSTYQQQQPQLPVPDQYNLFPDTISFSSFLYKPQH